MIEKADHIKIMSKKLKTVKLNNLNNLKLQNDIIKRNKNIKVKVKPQIMQLSAREEMK